MTDTAAPAQPAQPAQPATPEWRNLFGVCAAIGEDLGFDPLWLRIGFAVPLIWQPALVLSVYAAAGLVVLVSRLAYPARERTVAAEPIAFVARAQLEEFPSFAQAA